MRQKRYFKLRGEESSALRDNIQITLHVLTVQYQGEFVNFLMVHKTTGQSTDYCSIRGTCYEEKVAYHINICVYMYTGTSAIPYFLSYLAIPHSPTPGSKGCIFFQLTGIGGSILSY